MSHVMRKPVFCICENKGAYDQCLCFHYMIKIVQSFYFLNQKSQASSHLLWLYSPFCVGPGQKPQRQVLSRRGSFLPIFQEEKYLLCEVRRNKPRLSSNSEEKQTWSDRIYGSLTDLYSREKSERNN